MKKYGLYIISFLVLIALILLLLTGDNKKSKKIDDRITLRKEDKVPYGAFIAFDNLKYIFPNAAISASKKKTGYWDSLSNYETGQVLLIISPNFYASEFEMKSILRFAEKGNDVFVSATNISRSAEALIRCESSVISSDGDAAGEKLALQLLEPFEDRRVFKYNGRRFNSWFFNWDSTIAELLGTDDMRHANFIHLKSGYGNVFFHLAPLAFSNYFLLQGDNISYYENVLSVISPNSKRVVWDEYYVEKKNEFAGNTNYDRGEKEGNFVSELFKYEELKWALLTALFALVLYVLVEMRRKQRLIPEIVRPANDSLDFVKTIGRLYFDKGDHTNLCWKMGAYFLEYVRNKYKIATGTLDEEFIKKLMFKTDCEEHQIRGIVSFIKYLDEGPKVTKDQLIDFHKQLEIFYAKE